MHVFVNTHLALQTSKALVHLQALLLPSGGASLPTEFPPCAVIW